MESLGERKQPLLCADVSAADRVTSMSSQTLSSCHLTPTLFLCYLLSFLLCSKFRGLFGTEKKSLWLQNLTEKISKSFEITIRNRQIEGRSAPNKLARNFGRL